MSYARMDHADWVRRNIRGKTLSPLGEKVAVILGIVGGGIYNAPINVDKIDWSDTYRIAVVWSRTMATYDFNEITMLVLLCHEARIRVQLEGCGPRMIRLSFSQRTHDGPLHKRHPSIEQAVATFREYLGSNHPLTYREPDPVAAAAE